MTPLFPPAQHPTQHPSLPKGKGTTGLPPSLTLGDALVSEASVT